MKAPEMTDDLKNDLEILTMRQSLSGKAYNSAKNLKIAPKFFQVCFHCSEKVLIYILIHINSNVILKLSYSLEDNTV